MVDSFSNRQKGFEAKFSIDQETEFKISVRRNKLLGLWLAEKLGILESEVNDYANGVIASDLEEPGDEDVIRKCMSDIQERGAKITDGELRDKLANFSKEAQKQIMGE